MNDQSLRPKDPSVEEQIAQLEERLARIEEFLQLTPPTKQIEIVEEEPTVPAPVVSEDEDELEMEVGQNWFAKVGIVVLAVGVAFALSLPYDGLPLTAPSLFGYFLAGSIFLLSYLWRNAFELVSRYLRGAGMALLFYSTVRLFYFGSEPTLSTDSAFGIALLSAVVAANLTIAIRKQSPYLLGLALITGCTTTVIVGATWFVLTVLVLFSTIVVYARLRFDWLGLFLWATALTYLTHLVWLLMYQTEGKEMLTVTSPSLSIYILLIYSLVFATGTYLRKGREKEDVFAIVGSFLNGGGSFTLFFVSTLVPLSRDFVFAYVVTSILFLGLAIAFWRRERSRYSTFVYAMVGYMALSVAIMQSFAVPNVFVWLSLESIVVVATAVLFGSRFIVVANFFIYIVTVLAYMIVAEEESGISLGFGVVALVSARILNWQKDRLELKTEMMRNAYLISAFVVFPYALYHLVPQAYVTLSWVGVAIFYYVMNLIVKSQKYRWMGHLTLMLTVLYVVIIGIIQLESTYRILSFLVLGTVLLIVSLVFTRLRARKRAMEADPRQAS